ncbi:MAG: arginase family protein [Pseudomonadota bacterium]
MEQRWIVSPQYFEAAEPGLAVLAPPDAVRNGPHALADRSDASMALVHRPIVAFVRDEAAAGRQPVSLTGDCCAAIPVLAGLQAAGIAPAVVWVDAHGDFNTPETSPSQFLGGMPLAMMAGRGPQGLMAASGAAAVAEERIVLVDGRDLDPLEAEAVAGSGLVHIEVAALGDLRLPAPVLLHIDMDVLDAAEAPAFNYPVKGGPGPAALAEALAGFSAANRIACLSISGWTPSIDADGRTATACREALKPLIG